MKTNHLQKKNEQGISLQLIHQMINDIFYFKIKKCYKIISLTKHMNKIKKSNEK